jgi:hypothetical protein
MDIRDTAGALGVLDFDSPANGTSSTIRTEIADDCSCGWQEAHRRVSRAIFPLPLGFPYAIRLKLGPFASFVITLGPPGH